LASLASVSRVRVNDDSARNACHQCECDGGAQKKPFMVLPFNG